MNNRNFATWLATFRQSINSYGYYTDFKRVYANAEKLKIEISMLNTLVGAKTLRRNLKAF